MSTLIAKVKPAITPMIKQSKKRNRLTIWVFLLPALIPLTFFWIYPMLYSFYISLTNWDYMSPKYEFVGLQNYIELLMDPLFYGVLWNTLYFAMGVVFPSVFGGLLLALSLGKKGKGMGFYRTLIFSPWITPTVAVSIVWSWIFEPQVGVANWLLSTLNLPTPEWLGSTTWAMPAVIIVTVWKGLGWSMIFYLNALKKVPESLYEAAALDGASSIQKFFHITLPLISPTTLFLSVIMTIDSLQAYDQIQVLTQGGPAGSTRTVLYFYYQTAFEQFAIGKATAIATVLIVITGTLAFVQFVLARRWVHYQ